MADHRNGPLLAVDRAHQGVDRGAGRELLVDLHRYSHGAPDLPRGLSGAEEWAREYGMGRFVTGGEALAERTGLLEPYGRELAKLVRLAGGGVGMSTEIDAHRLGRIGATRGSPARKAAVRFARYNLIV